MKKLMLMLLAFGSLGLGVVSAEDYRNGIQWEEPALVQPGKTPGAAPSDAVVLFDGKNLDAWEGGAWEVKDGVLTVNPKTGDIRSKEKFGSCQVHLEFMTPPAESKGQGRGNSGLFLMAHYEVQILDSYNNPTYYDGMCGSIYKQSPPYVNVCKKPGEWQTYDVIFTRPIVRKEGDKVVEIIRPAYITAILNGVVVQNHFAVQGETYWHKAPEYLVHEDKEPIRLQDHNNRMKFRNIWVRNIPDSNDIQRDKVMPFIFNPKTMKEAFEKKEKKETGSAADKTSLSKKGNIQLQKQNIPAAPAKQK